MDPRTSPAPTVTVYPSVSCSYWELVDISNFLENLYGECHVKFNDQDGDLSWTITIQSNHTIETMKSHPQLHFTPEDAKRATLVSSEDPKYLALAANPEDEAMTKATREFLNSKVSDKDEEHNTIELHVPGTRCVYGWGNLMLNDQAKKEVEAHPGIKAPLGDDVEGSYD